MDFATGLSTLNIILGDTDNFTFTTEEKTRALTEAWRDRYVTTTASNTSNIFDSSIQDYTVTGIPVPVDLDYSTAGTWGLPLPSDAWHMSGNTLTINEGFRYIIPQGATLRIRGRYKLTITDSITNEQMQEYVLTLAHLATLKLLGAKKTNRFIKNDTNMNEIIALRNSLALDVRNLRQGLQSTYERM